MLPHFDGAIAGLIRQMALAAPICGNPTRHAIDVLTHFGVHDDLAGAQPGDGCYLNAGVRAGVTSLTSGGGCIGTLGAWRHRWLP